MRPKSAWFQLSVLVPALFYLTFVVLYVACLTQIWVQRSFIMDRFVGDASIMEYDKIYMPVFGLGAILFLEAVVVLLLPGLKKLVCFSHLIIGICSLVYCVWLWNFLNSSFNLFHSSSWYLQGANPGPGYYLFVGASVTLTISGLCALRAFGNKRGSVDEGRRES